MSGKICGAMIGYCRRPHGHQDECSISIEPVAPALPPPLSDGLSELHAAACSWREADRARETAGNTLAAADAACHAELDRRFRVGFVSGDADRAIGQALQAERNRAAEGYTAALLAVHVAGEALLTAARRAP
jgi:hypothetical protein